MENKINIAELLKDCPKGMELDCTMFDNVTFVRVDNSRERFPIEIIVSGLYTKYLTKEGCYHDNTLLLDAKCVIFPKGKTTWEGFHGPFVDGDVVTGKNCACSYIAIFKEFIDDTSFSHYVCLTSFGKLRVDDISDNANLRLATPKENEKLFDAINDKGYRWNEETKTLSKFVQPNFEVGNKIEKCGYSFTIAEVKDDYYLTKCGNRIPIDYQDDFSLVPNKFDITNLKPFDKVLIRDKDTDKWNCQFFNYYYKNSDRPYVCIGCEGLNDYKQCIPYEENKHLVGTTNDCDDYYKIW